MMGLRCVHPEDVQYPLTRTLRKAANPDEAM